MPHVARTGAISSVIAFVAWSACPLSGRSGSPCGRGGEGQGPRHHPHADRGAAPTSRSPQGDGATALHWAAHWDDAAIADVLIAAGATVDAADDHGVTPLALACLNGSTTMVERLLEGGRQGRRRIGRRRNAADDCGRTPAMPPSWRSCCRTAPRTTPQKPASARPP